MTPYYADDLVTIYHGDMRDVMPSLSPVDVVLTDPPFSVPLKYQAAAGNHPRSWGDLAVMEPWAREVLTEIRRAVKVTGQTYVCCDGETYPVFYRAGYSLWPQSHLLVWYKPTGRRGRGWMHSYELVLHLRNPETEYEPGFRQDVVGIMPVRTLKQEHPAEKPGSLWTFLLEGAVADGSVLDPFMGSGSALIAARATGRKAIGIEIEERYCEIAAQRCAQEVLGLSA